MCNTGSVHGAGARAVPGRVKGPRKPGWDGNQMTRSSLRETGVSAQRIQAKRPNGAAAGKTFRTSCADIGTGVEAGLPVTALTTSKSSQTAQSSPAQS